MRDTRFGILQEKHDYGIFLQNAARLRSGAAPHSWYWQGGLAENACQRVLSLL